MNARAAGWALFALLWGTADTARALDAPGTLPFSLESHAGRLRVTLDLSPAFPTDLARQLGNGLTNVIAVHVALSPEHGEDPVAFYGREIDILYDVWEETYRVTVKDVEADRPRSQQLVLRDFPALRKFLADLRGVDLGPAWVVAAGSWVLQTRIEVNPVSKELLERTREFIANPPAGSRMGGSSRSVLGVMASYLLRSTDPGTEVHHFRTGPFTQREVAVR